MKQGGDDRRRRRGAGGQGRPSLQPPAAARWLLRAPVRVNYGSYFAAPGCYGGYYVAAGQARRQRHSRCLPGAGYRPVRQHRHWLPIAERRCWSRAKLHHSALVAGSLQTGGCSGVSLIRQTRSGKMRRIHSRLASRSSLPRPASRASQKLRSRIFRSRIADARQPRSQRTSIYCCFSVDFAFGLAT